MADHELDPFDATSGIRRGEIAGLRWHNVCRDAARLTVNRQVVSVQYQLIASDLKVSTSRDIDIDPRSGVELCHPLEECVATGQRSDDGCVSAKLDRSPIHVGVTPRPLQRRHHDLLSTRHTRSTGPEPHPPLMPQSSARAGTRVMLNVSPLVPRTRRD